MFSVGRARGGSRRSRTVARYAVILGLGFGLALPQALASDAGSSPEPKIYPIDGAFDLDGRGYGHGRGMSQWGAQGAATLGAGYREILDFYYPGTRLATSSDRSRIRVHITAEDHNLQVRPASGLKVVAGRGAQVGRRVLPTHLGGQQVTAWRASKSDTGRLRVTGRAGGTWRTVKVGGRANLHSPVRFIRLGSRPVRLILNRAEERDYRGALLAVADARTSGAFRVVNRVKMRHYLQSVVPSESYSTWKPAALQAQAVAARSYAKWRARNIPLGFADVCDTTACQVYHGMRQTNGRGTITRVWEADSTNEAIRVTSGRYLTYGGLPALTEFSASNGGHSTAGHVPYLIAQPDPWDGVVGSVAHAWEKRLTVQAVAAAFRTVGAVEALRVMERDGNGPWGGRVVRVRVIGSAGQVTVAGTTFASRLGLLHSWWRAQSGPAPTPTPEVEVKSRPRPVPTPSPAPATTPVATPIPPESSGDADPASAAEPVATPTPPTPAEPEAPEEPAPVADPSEPTPAS